MPSVNELTDRFLATLSWEKAIRTVARDHVARNAKRRAQGLPEKQLKEPRQVSYLQRLERGLSLMCVVSAGGTRAFWAVTYKNSRPVYRKLGTYPNLSVKQARDAARDYFKNRDKRDAEAEVGSFKVVAEQWFKRHVEKKQLRSAYELRRQLTIYLYLHWDKLKFLSIKRSDVANLLDKIEGAHGAAMADYVLSTVRGIMNWYATRHDDYLAPIVRGMRRSESKPRERILSDQEIRQLWATGAEYGTFGALLKLGLLTAQRKEKVTAMRWDDISKDGVWTIPTQEREKGTPGSLLLSDLALAIIDAQPHLSGNPFVFAGPGRGRFNSSFRCKIDLDAKLNFAERWTIHDLRRTARSLMSRAGVQADVAERVLGHAIPGIRGIYDRHSYADEKADALQRLAAEIERIISPPPADNVVPLRR